MHSRGARLARGWVVGAFATAIASLSHALGGGTVPSGLALLAGLLFSGMLATLAAGRTPSLPRLAVAVIGGQLAFHLLFSYLGVPTSATPTSAAPTSATRTSTTLASLPPMPTHGHIDLTVVTTGHHHADGASMWIAHAIAALVTIAFLRFAERAVWSLLAQVVDWVVRPFRTSRPLPVRAHRAAPLPLLAPSLLVSRLLDAALSRRGPPLSVAF
jgi:hypothetical protein